jgi:hypothetical protein
MAVGARKYSIPFQIALLRSDGLACREILAPAAPVNQEKQLFFQLFHPLFFYCFLNSFN